MLKADLKLISEALATRLKGILPDLISPKQTAYVKNSFYYVFYRSMILEERFLKWIQIVIKSKESCVVDGGITTKFFSLDRVARQGDPISAFLFIFALEVSFVLIKSNNNMKGLNIYGHTFYIQHTQI